MSTKKTEFEVDMMCDGCGKAVRAVLSKVEGVSNIQIDWQKHQVIVEGTADNEAMLNAIKKTGKRVKLVS